MSALLSWKSLSSLARSFLSHPAMRNSVGATVESSTGVGMQIEQRRWTSRRPFVHTKRRHTQKRGAKKYPGEYAEAGMILHRQIGLHIYPGENVGCGRDCTLFAIVPGRVLISTELLKPYPDSPLYPAVRAGRKIYKQFYHILPEPQHQKFRLVSQT